MSFLLKHDPQRLAFTWLSVRTPCNKIISLGGLASPPTLAGSTRVYDRACREQTSSFDGLQQYQILRPSQHFIRQERSWLGNVTSRYICLSQHLGSTHGGQNLDFSAVGGTEPLGSLLFAHTWRVLAGI